MYKLTLRYTWYKTVNGFTDYQNQRDVAIDYCYSDRIDGSFELSRVPQPFIYIDNEDLSEYVLDTPTSRVAIMDSGKVKYAASNTRDIPLITGDISKMPIDPVAIGLCAEEPDFPDLWKSAFFKGEIISRWNFTMKQTDSRPRVICKAYLYRVPESSISGTLANVAFYNSSSTQPFLAFSPKDALVPSIRMKQGAGKYNQIATALKVKSGMSYIFPQASFYHYFVQSRSLDNRNVVPNEQLSLLINALDEVFESTTKKTASLANDLSALSVAVKPVATIMQPASFLVSNNSYNTLEGLGFHYRATDVVDPNDISHNQRFFHEAGEFYTSKLTSSIDSQALANYLDTSYAHSYISGNAIKAYVRELFSQHTDLINQQILDLPADLESFSSSFLCSIFSETTDESLHKLVQLLNHYQVSGTIDESLFPILAEIINDSLASYVNDVKGVIESRFVGSFIQSLNNKLPVQTYNSGDFASDVIPPNDIVAVWDSSNIDTIVNECFNPIHRRVNFKFTQSFLAFRESPESLHTLLKQHLTSEGLSDTNSLADRRSDFIASVARFLRTFSICRIGTELNSSSRYCVINSNFNFVPQFQTANAGKTYKVHHLVPAFIHTKNFDRFNPEVDVNGLKINVSNNGVTQFSLGDFRLYFDFYIHSSFPYCVPSEKDFSLIDNVGISLVSTVESVATQTLPLSNALLVDAEGTNVVVEAKASAFSNNYPQVSSGRRQIPSAYTYLRGAYVALRNISFDAGSFTLPTVTLQPSSRELLDSKWSELTTSQAVELFSTLIEHPLNAPFCGDNPVPRGCCAWLNNESLDPVYQLIADLNQAQIQRLGEMLKKDYSDSDEHFLKFIENSIQTTNGIKVMTIPDQLKFIKGFIDPTRLDTRVITNEEGVIQSLTTVPKYLCAASLLRRMK